MTYRAMQTNSMKSAIYTCLFQSTPVRIMERSIFSAKYVFVENLFRRYNPGATHTVYNWGGMTEGTTQSPQPLVILIKKHLPDIAVPGIATSVTLPSAMVCG